MTYELSQRLAAAAGAAAAPESSVASRLLCGARHHRREKGLKRFFAQQLQRWLRSSTTPKAPQVRQPLLWKLDRIAAQIATAHPVFCTAPLRAAAPKERRLTNRDECTCDRAAVAYTRSALP